MRSLRRILAGLTTLGIFAAAGQTANAVPIRTIVTAPALRSFTHDAVREAPRSTLAFRDLGRRQSLAPVRATVTLRYNHQAELEALVAILSNRRSPLYHHFLTSAQFNNYFAPTVQQQAFVVAKLGAAGLRVTHTYPNRTLLDLEGTSAAAERFFGTEIHSVVQGRFGVRFANVKAAEVPLTVAPFVRSVSLSNVIFARTGPHVLPHSASTLGFAQAFAQAALRNRAPPSRRLPTFDRFLLPAYRAPGAAGVVADPGFESGAFGHGWAHCETAQAAPLATIASAQSSSGKYAGRAGSTSRFAGGQNGYAGVCQLVTIPAGAILSASLYQLSNEKTTMYAAQDVLLLDTSGHVVTNLAQTVANRAGWVAHSWNLAQFAGRQLYLYFGVHGDGNRGTYTEQFVDTVAFVAANPQPTPTPVPVATPTAAPVPTATPTALPTTAACTGAPNNGPLHNGFGYLATGVATAFDYPVQHGCNGAGTTVAVEISSPVQQRDIDAYMSAAGVTQRGTITNVPVDGGGSYGGSSSEDTLEASLDVETIAGLAPGANIRVYNFPDLSDQHIEDGYDQMVSDNIASVANSSFGGCESQDSSFSSTTNEIALQAAAKGITFVASSGDSGSSECGTNNAPGPAGPAGNPNFVSVGGANFTEDSVGKLLTLTAEGDVAGTSYLSGGGVSTLFARPAYQSNIPNTIASGRNSPDLSLPGVGVAIYVGGTALDADGTSWSSPCFVALLAEASQLHGARFGFVNQAIYNVFTSKHYADFTDVTIGNNGAYSARTGYDLVTGLGAPQGFAFASAL